MTIHLRILGVIFDSTYSLRDHVANVCRSINFNLYSIGKIRKYLDRPTVEKLVNATITSRLDYCNSLMFGIPKELITQLQQMRQNHAARVMTQWRKYDHITPVLVDLHWLPVKQRIDFKILLLTYKALNGLAPAYLREQLVPYSPTRTLRSKKNINWHLHDVDWRTLAKGLLLQLHQCCGTIYLLTSNDPRPWTFSSLVLRLIFFNLHILRDCLNVCVNVWLCYYFMLCTLG